MGSASPRPHQVEALADLVRAFAVHDRAQLRMACGTGKTLVGSGTRRHPKRGTHTLPVLTLQRPWDQLILRHGLWGATTPKDRDELVATLRRITRRKDPL